MPILTQTTAPERLELPTKGRQVAVLRLPATPAATEAFLRAARKALQPAKPLLVVDCPAAAPLNPGQFLLLLECLKAAMLRCGDVRLAGVTLAGLPISGDGQATRLFETFDTVEEAVDSYHLFAAAVA